VIQLWFLVSFQLVVLVLVSGFRIGPLGFQLDSFFFSFFLFLLVLFLGRSLFFIIDRAMQQPAWRVVVSSVSYHGHVETETGRPDGVETKRSSFVSAFYVFKLKSWLFSGISNLCGEKGRTRRKICSRSNIRKTFLDTYMLKELVIC